MSIAYYRVSQHSQAETIDRLKKAAEKKGFSVLGESLLPKGETTVVTVCRPQWAETIVDADPNLLGLLPCSVAVIEKDAKVTVGAGMPALLGQVVRTEQMNALVESAESELRALIEEAAGVEPLRPKLLKLYSSHTCPYCMMEKKWLDEKKVNYELIYVDENQEVAIDLVKRTGQQGVPQTEVIFDNDESEFIVGFDRPKLEKIVASM